MAHTRLEFWAVSVQPLHHGVAGHEPVSLCSMRRSHPHHRPIHKWVAEGRFASRSEAIKTIVAMHQERERTREFYKLLLERSGEAREKPEILLSLEEGS